MKKTHVPILVVVFLSGFFSSERSPIFPNWYLQNPLSYNLDNLSKPVSAYKIKTSANNPVDSGTAEIIATPSEINNIVLLVLEGFSENHILEGLAPIIGFLTTKGIHSPYFVNNQVQTNRGLYSLLCGKYPNLINYEAKADILIASKGLDHCFPHLLKEHGFKNYFSQSAPLSYMSKDLFAKEAGFELALGAKSFPSKYIISEWGISDSALLAGVFKILSENKNEKKFISILTVGTHHPYTTPETSGSLPKAISYTDRVVGEFYGALKKSGFFKDGLLIITSDESKPTRYYENPLMHNRGLFLMLSEQLPVHKHTAIFSQTDLKNTMFDLFKKSFKGRSLLRSYSNSNRPILFAHAFRNKTGMIKDHNTTILCDSFFNCSELIFPSNIFDSSFDSVEPNSNQVYKLRSFINGSDLKFIDQKVLYDKKSFALEKPSKRNIFADLKTNSKINDNLELYIKYEYKSRGKLPNELIWKYYPCLQSSEVKSKAWQIDFGSTEQTYKLALPASLLSSNICHSLTIVNNGSIKIEQLKLQRSN